MLTLLENQNKPIVKKTILALSFITLVFLNTSRAQSLADLESITKTEDKVSLNERVNSTTLAPNVGAVITLGFQAGGAFVEDNTGLTVGMFANVGYGSFSFVPQANYWRVENSSNFELCALARIKLSNDRKLEPYLDGGIGINFFDNKVQTVTKVGLDVGGGLRLYDVGNNFNLIFDGKYKIIVSDVQPQGNISGYFITAGIEFSL